MLSFEDIFFKALFNTPIPRVILKADVPDFTIISYNEAYKKATNNQQHDITGLFLWDVYDPKDSGSDGGQLLLKALIEAATTNQPVHMPPFQYNIPSGDGINSMVNWWQLEIVPITGNSGTVEYLLVTTNNITEELFQQQVIEDGKLREQHLHEEILSINEELSAANEELKDTNEDLMESQENLTKLNKELEVRVIKRTRELVASNMRLKTVFEQSPLGFYTLNGPELVIELINDHMLKLWNKSRDIIGKAYTVVRPESNSFIKTLKEVYYSGNTFKADEMRIPIVDDPRYTHKYFNLIYQPIKNEQNITTGILAIIEDVNDKVMYRQKTERINAQLHLAVEAAKIGSWNIDLETKALHCNLMLLKLFGYEGSTPLTYERAMAQVTDEYRDRVISEIDNAINNGGDYDITYSQRRFNDGEVIWLRSLGRISQDETGNYPIFSGVVMDITAQLLATREIEAKQHQLKTMVLTAPIGTAVLRGREFAVEIANGHILKMWGRNFDDVRGKPLLEIFPELKDQPFPEMLAQVYHTGERLSISEIEAKISTPEGLKTIYVNFSYDPLFAQDGTVEAILVTVINITEIVDSRKSLEKSQREQQTLNEQLRAMNEEMTSLNEELYQTQGDLMRILAEVAESESRLRYLLQDAPVAIAVMKGRDLLIEAANKRILEIWGKTDKVIGKPLHLAMPELEGQQFLQILDNVYTSGEPFIGNELKVLVEVDGLIEEIYCSFVYHALKDADGNINSIMVVASVVTEQVKARQRVESAQQQFRQAVDSANLGTWGFDPVSGALSFSDRSKQLFGFLPEEEVSYEEAIKAVDPDYQQLVRSTVEKGLTKFESCDIEYPINSLASKQRKWLRVTGKMFFDDNGKPAHFSGLFMDITDRKLEEQRKDDFISVASHELKTPVTTLKGSIQLLKRMKDKASPDVIAELIEQANKSMNKVTDLIDNFLNVNRLSGGQMPLNKTTFAIAEMLENCCNHVRSAGQFELIVEGDKELKIFADLDRIDQVIVNFVNNAVKYAPNSTKIYMSIEQIGDSVKVAVKDTGAGIPPEKIDYLFGRYYRADYSGFQYSGLGLGLYISAEIIKRHNGEIGVDSELGKGSTFWFTLPTA